ncbi:MAG TPA: PAS domain S-box protein [Gemmatimonadaceae bacterium]|nr:PAS domain S-box protein [Gemmatimonadaceae bacterium]
MTETLSSQAPPWSAEVLRAPELDEAARLAGFSWACILQLSESRSAWGEGSAPPAHEPPPWDERLTGAAPILLSPDASPDSLYAWIARQCAALWSGDAREHEVLLAAVGSGLVRPWASPLLVAARPVDPSGALSDAVVRLLALVAAQVVRSRTAAAATSAASHRADRFRALQQLAALLTRSLDEHEIIDALAAHAPRLLDATGIIVALVDRRHGREPVLRVVQGAVAGGPEIALTAPHPLAEAVRQGRPRIVPADDDWNAGSLPDAGDGEEAQEDRAERDRHTELLVAPMRSGNGLLGVLATERVPGGRDSQELDALAALAAQAAIAIDNARLYESSQRERRQSEALADITRAVSESLRLQEVLDLIMRYATALLRVEGACMTLRDGDVLDVVSGTGVARALEGMRLPLDGSLTGRAIRRGQPLIVNTVGGDDAGFAPAVERAGVERTMVVPMYNARGAIGTLSVVNRATPFDDEDARVLQRLADQIAVAVVNARLFEEVETATLEWQVAFDAIGAGMVVLDVDGTIRRSNSRAARLAGVQRRDQLIGRPFAEAVLHEPGDAELVQRVLAPRGQVRVTIRSSARGRIFDVLAAPHPAGGAVVTFDDVTSYHLLAERHRRVIETTRDAIVITNTERRIVFANPAACALLGHAHDALLGMAVAELVAPEQEEEVRHRHEYAIAGEPQRYETVIARPDGSRRIVSVSTAPLDELGEITGVLASLRDITEERLARDAVVRSEARYRNLVETASDAIFTLDTRGICTSANLATCRITGLAREELIGRPVATLIDTQEFEPVREHMLDTLAGTPHRFECRLFHRSGNARLLSVTTTPIFERGAVVGILGVARDVTEERARDAALIRSEARYLRLVESATDGIFTVDRDARFISVNRSLERSVGRGRGELIGQRVLELLDPDCCAAMQEMFDQTMAGARQRGEIRFRGGDGSLRIGSITTTPILEDGQVTGGLGIVRDVTDERQMAAHLMQQEKLAAVGQLVSGVAHELNNPLAGIVAFSQLLMAAPGMGPEQVNAVTTIQKEAKRAARIVSNLLLFARQRPPERAETDLNQVLMDTLELRRYALRTQQITVDLDLEPELPITWADPFQLQQVMLNLLTNAEHAVGGVSGERKILLRTRRSGAWLHASVTDTGVGIAPDAMERIFNPFYSTKPVGEGTGLGLSISDGIVREHGGRIVVRSEPGRGATFTMQVPLVPAPETREPGTPRAPLPAVPRRVLLVDDEPSARSALALYLGNAGHDVDVVGSGAEALARMRERRYDAILLDLRMPDMGGHEVYAALLSRDAAQARRVVFVTGDAEGQVTRAFLRQAGRPCLRKPFALEEVAAMLAAVEDA